MLIDEQDKKFIRLAIEQARLARENGNEPFGAVLVKDGELIAVGQNQIHTMSDRTYHAELGLIRDYCQLQKISELSKFTLYSSCEPCVMCAAAMVWSKLGRLVYSVTNETLERIAGGGINIPCEKIFEKSFYKPEFTGGVLENEGQGVFDGYVWD